MENQPTSGNTSKEAFGEQFIFDLDAEMDALNNNAADKNKVKDEEEKPKKNTGGTRPPPHPLLVRQSSTGSGVPSSLGATSPSPPVSPTPKANNVSSGTGGGENAHAKKRTHNRGVSWDNNAKAPFEVRMPDISLNQRDETIGTLTPGGEAGGVAGVADGGVSMRSLVGQSPLETEAETHILEALEEMDPTTTAPGPSEAQKGILGDVAPDVEPGTFEVEERHEQVKAALPLLDPSHRKSKSTAEDLFDLTRELKQMQTKNRAASLSGSSLDGDIDRNISSADALAQNATKLVKRHQAPSEDSEKAETPAAVGLAGDKFKNLLQRAKSKRNATEDDNSSPGDAPQNQTDTGTGDDPSDKKRWGEPNRQPTSSKKPNKMAISTKATMKVKAKYREFEDWLKWKRMGLWTYAKVVLFVVIIPATGLAAILFYAAGNPPCGNGICRPKLQTNSTAVKTIISASASWWILFVLVRQVITLTFARATQAFLVDYLALHTRLLVSLLGPLITLFVVQSKGWPLILFLWAAFDFALLYGRHAFAKHWLYWQDAIDMCNSNNPAGTVTQSSEYTTVLIVAMVVGFVTAIKRCWVGVTLGRQTYERYSEELATVMKKSLLIGQVASLAKNLEYSKIDLDSMWFHVNTNDEPSVSGSLVHSVDSKQAITLSGGLLDGIDLRSSSARINQFLGEWEEPEDQRHKSEKSSIGAIIQFRQSLSCLNSSVPFSAAFGPATTRQECVACAEALYHRLLSSTPEQQLLPFDVIALLAIDSSGDLDEVKVKELIRLFRPDREGDLTLLDFCKSIDAVYKDLRLLRASISNSSKTLFNVFYYIIVFLLVVAAVGIDPFVLFASLSAFVVGFGFMIGNACSQYILGLLLIFVRRPYDIGDRINVSKPDIDVTNTGSPGWIVKDIGLYTTTVIYGSTNEVATYSNSSLAASRIINAARSPKASLLFFLKFPIDTKYEKIQVFKTSLEKFIKARPRSWAAFSAFRASSVEVDLGYVEYTVVAQHRESWQNIGALLTSKAELSSFALELSKRMNMRYRSPPMPVDLNVKGNTSELFKDKEQILLPKMMPADIPPGTTKDRSASVGTASFLDEERALADYDEVAGMFDTSSPK